VADRSAAEAKTFRELVQAPLIFFTGVTSRARISPQTFAPGCSGIRPLRRRPRRACISRGAGTRSGRASISPGATARPSCGGIRDGSGRSGATAGPLPVCRRREALPARHVACEARGPLRRRHVGDRAHHAPARGRAAELSVTRVMAAVQLRMVLGRRLVR
jgi:hypothetical protein